MKKEKLIRFTMSAAMVFLMCFVSELVGDKEVIFPEIAALTVGAWLLPKNPWKTTKLRMIILMTLSAVAGISIVRFVPLEMPFKLIIGFIFTAVCVSLSKTSMTPIISACILPVMMSTTTIVYPISVFIMTIIIALGQVFLEKLGYNASSTAEFNKQLSSFEVFEQWTKRLVLFSAMLILPVMTGEYLFMAPPLIVTFVAFTDYSRPARKKPLRTIVITVFAAFIGSFGRILSEFTPLPLYACALIAMLMLFAVFEVSKEYFPPCGAIALLPLIIGSEKIFIYPIEVSIGCVLFIGISTLFYWREAEIEQA